MPSKLSYTDRASSESNPPLLRYLYSLISIKHTNLCVSADVYTTDELLSLAEEVGDFICVLKTHADTIDDFSDRTIRGLQEIAQRKHFLLFEDRKLGDIGNTVQAQYTRGPLRIATWAHLTNAHLLPGPAIVPSLHSAAISTLSSLNHSFATTISSTAAPLLTEPVTSSSSDSPTDSKTPTPQPAREPAPEGTFFTHHRSSSTSLTATTTISQTSEPASPPAKPPSLVKSLSQDYSSLDPSSSLSQLGAPPHARGLLLLAEMSSEGNLCTKSYTQTCVSSAQQNPNFVVGFISQTDIVPRGSDFAAFTPGVGLPPEGQESGAGGLGDGKGQVWRTPEVAVGEGADVIIVGRGILKAGDRKVEAERYRKRGWEAYEKVVA